MLDRWPDYVLTLGCNVFVYSVYNAGTFVNMTYFVKEMLAIVTLQNGMYRLLGSTSTVYRVHTSCMYAIKQS